MNVIRYKDLPSRIKSILAGCDKYPDFLAWRENKPDCIKVRFNGEITPFYLRDGVWVAGETYKAR